MIEPIDHDADGDSEERFHVIPDRYLAVQNIPYYVDADGTILLERSWHRDFMQHLQYLSDFSLAAPQHPLPSKTDDLVPLDDAQRRRFILIRLPAAMSRMQAVLQLPAMVWILGRAIAKADIVHTGVNGWPLPVGWAANPIARLLGKKRLIVVESTGWRRPPSQGAATSLRARLIATLYERLARYWCDRADLSFYTQPTYLADFHRNGRGPAYVAPAVWVNSEDVLSDAQANALWKRKLSEPPRFLFAGRLVDEKGVPFLLSVARRLSDAGIRGELHVIGEGPLRNDVISGQGSHPFRVSYFEPIPYGAPFFSFLQRYHAVIVPSFGDEQPRIVFDAAARGVPVIASDTDGLRPHVDDGNTGLLFPPGNEEKCIEAIVWSTGNSAFLREAGLEALSRVRTKTHRAMHARRSALIARHLAAQND